MGSRPDPDGGQGTLDIGAPARAAADEPPAPAAELEIPFTWSEAWRRECEARYMMTLSLEERRAYYAGVRKQRGEAAMKELIAEVNRQWALANPL